MSKRTYNLIELSATGEIDAVGVFSSQGFASDFAYADELTAFLKKAPKYLQYLPGVIVCVDSTREEFLTEVAQIKQEAGRLGVNGIIPTLNDLTEAATNLDVKVISDKLVQYKAKLAIITGLAERAAVTEEEKPLVLAVDDMPEILTILTEVLRPQYGVIATASVKDAIKALEVHKPDVFILDIIMPGENGLEFAKYLREHEAHRSAPILFLTDSSNKEYVMSAKEFGTSAYILKPINKDVLLKRIAKALGRQA